MLDLEKALGDDDEASSDSAAVVVVVVVDEASPVPVQDERQAPGVRVSKEGVACEDDGVEEDHLPQVPSPPPLNSTLVSLLWRLCCCLI